MEMHVPGEKPLLASGDASVTLTGGRQTLLFCSNLAMPFTGSLLLGAALNNKMCIVHEH